MGHRSQLMEKLKKITNPEERMKLIKEWQQKKREVSPVSNWQEYGSGEEREKIPTMRQGALQRGLSRLHKMTKVRRGPTGEREFLLYRTLDNEREEYESVDMDEHMFEIPKTKTSWSPMLKYAKEEAKIMRELVVGVWIPESLISNIPKMYGNFDRGVGENKWAKEWEVIVDGNKGRLHRLKIEFNFSKYFEPGYVKE